MIDIESNGLEVTVASHRALYHYDELLRAWIGTTTWTESAAFFQKHNAELIRPQIRKLLSYNSKDPDYRQHLAILYLADNLPPDEVYQIVTDVSVASERALDLVESGDLNQLTSSYVPHQKQLWKE